MSKRAPRRAKSLCIEAYVREVGARKAADQPGVRRWLKVKRWA